MDGFIGVREADYLLENKPETPRFYTLPKIHKGFDPFPSQRPIVSGCNSVCERLSNFVDYHLKGPSQKNASFVKDTTDFVRKIQNVEIVIIVSADVSINHEKGAEACREALERRTDVERRRILFC